MAPIVKGMQSLAMQLRRVGYVFTIEDLVPGANIILDRAQQLCPVDTGNLQKSGFIQAEGDDNLLIGFEAEYASFVEMGTYKMAAQPFLRPAFDEMQNEALGAIADSIESHMRNDIVGGGVQTSGNAGGLLQP